MTVNGYYIIVKYLLKKIKRSKSITFALILRVTSQLNEMFVILHDFLFAFIKYQPNRSWTTCTFTKRRDPGLISWSLATISAQQTVKSSTPSDRILMRVDELDEETQIKF